MRAAASPPPRSFWLREAGVDEEGPPLEGERRADVCIVGGGFTGLWTALALKALEPSLELALVEADVCGGGASGRNGGFAMSFWHHFAGLEHACGGADALALARASAVAVADLGAFCEAHGIDAGFRHDGWLWTATNRAQLGAGRARSPRSRATARLRSSGRARRARPPQRLRRAPRRRLRAQLGDAPAGAARAGRARRARARRRAVRALADAGARTLAPAGRAHAARSRPRGDGRDRDRGRGGRLAELRRAFVAVASDIVITEPAPAELERIGWRGGVSVSDSRLMVHYYRTTADGRVAFGKGGGRLAYGGALGAASAGRRRATPASPRGCARPTPSLAAVPIAASWTGPIDRTFDGLPFFCALGRPDLLAGAGYSGNGVGPSLIGGRILASLALGRDDEWSRCGLVRRPPRRDPAGAAAPRRRPRRARRRRAQGGRRGRGAPAGARRPRARAARAGRARAAGLIYGRRQGRRRPSAPGSRSSR